MSTQGTDYRDLKREVWDRGRCSGCGGCVAVCPADAILFNGKGDDSYPVTTGYCKHATDGVPCGACYAVCPRVAPVVSDAPLGTYRRIVMGKAEREIPRRQSGGAVTAILASALDEGLIDAVVTVTEDRWTLRPSSAVITSSEALIHGAGSRYSWWVPLLSALKTAVVERKYRRIAVVGVPCVAQAVERIRKSDHDLLRPYADSIRLVMGLFCTESFDYRTLVGEVLHGKHGIETWQVRRLDVKGKLVVTQENGATITIPLKDLEETVRSGCRVCTDLTAVSADISAGAIGSREGYTTLIIRSPVGEGFVSHAVNAGKLLLADGVDIPVIEKLAAAKREKGAGER
jgi:coenzyme F420 hydrogenase subunit beta